MEDIKGEFDEVINPEQLLEFMAKYINYGYLDKNGRVYHYDDEDFDDKWFEKYILESADDILKTLHGNCWDQVELERYWFENNGYEVKTIYEMVKLDYENSYPVHSFLIFYDKKDNSWNWFENADSKNRGIRKFSTIEELLKYQYACYCIFLKSFDISDSEISQIILTEFCKPKSNISAEEYLDFVVNSKLVFVDK